MREIQLNPKDAYIESLTPVEGEYKKQARQASEELGLARISVNAAEAQLLKIFLKLPLLPEESNSGRAIFTGSGILTKPLPIFHGPAYGRW